MENYTYSNFPDSGHSSPLSRDTDNNSWDEQPSYKVKLLCSYGGKIHPRPHHNQLTYLGGDTKIISVDRNTKFSTFISKLSSLSDSNVCFKYQLPGEDLDALISVTNDEDLDHMMTEYDRLIRGSQKPARLRLFLFPINTSSNYETKAETQWFVDALNSVQTQNTQHSTPDFLFGLDKNQNEPTKQISDSEMYQKKSDEANAIALYGESPVPVNVPAPYWPDRHVNTVTEPQVYLVPASAGVIRPVTGLVGQGYYGMQPMYAGVPPPQSRIVRPEQYAPVSYDGVGRQVFYAAPGRVVPPYQPVATQGGGSSNHEGKVVVPHASHNSSV